jgi:hypothetical protein
MNTVTLDLINEYSVSIGSTYKIDVQLCNAPDLMLYTGVSQIRSNISSTDILLTPNISILSKDLFQMVIPFTAFNTNIQPGNYVYDVLFTKTDDRFYAIAGKIQLVKRVTQI